MVDENIVNITKVLLALCTLHSPAETRVGERITKNMQNQHWQAEDVLIRHPITHLYVNEALESANESTAFPDMGCADCSPCQTETTAS